MINCCLCFHTENTEYDKHAYVTMLSCIRNTRSRVHFHLVATGLGEENRGAFRDLCEVSGHDLTLYDAPAIPDDVKADLPQQFGVGCLYLCALHEIIPTEKVLYVDCDVLFERDIAELDALDLQGKSVAAVRDLNLQRHHKDFTDYFQSLGLDVDFYVNTGVLLLDLARMREASREGNIYWRTFRELRARRPEIVLRFPDQDLLNLAFVRQGDVTYLDETCNWLMSYDQRKYDPPSELKGKILHFAGQKPWEAVYPAFLAYWKYEAMTPWGGDAVERLSELLIAPDMDMAWYARRHARSVARLRRLKDFLG